MSKPKYDWWPYVKSIVTRYPELKEAFGGAYGDAVRTSARYREYEAVRQAVEITGRYRDGSERIRVVGALFWNGSRVTLREAAQRTGCPVKSVKKWSTEFIYLVASCYGLMDCKWSATTIIRILQDETYTGTLVQGKQTTPHFKLKERLE